MWPTLRLLVSGIAALPLVTSTILQNGQVRNTNFPNTRIDPSAYSFTTYKANATEIAYKGRWDDEHVSWWS